MLLLIIIYLLAVNFCSFTLMYVDKTRARKHRWRISEITLILTAVLGGSVGSLFGMYAFHHKTRHPKFTIGIPVILVVQLVAAYYIATGLCWF